MNKCDGKSCSGCKTCDIYPDEQRIEFTKEMKKTYKILCPSMLDIHFKFIHDVFAQHGYDVEVLTNTDQSVIDEGLKYVHNDICYPALLCIGQLISALNSGKYDLKHTALVFSQTGGGCRASNYIHLLRKALRKAGYGEVPVISANLSGLEKNSGFTITLPLIRKALAAMVYGDMLMLLSGQTKAYEKVNGESEALVDKWVSKMTDQFSRGKGFSNSSIKKNLVSMVKSFESVPVNDVKRIKVGIVGEIYAKYSALANNNLEQFLLSQGCEVMIPGAMAFFLFKVDNRLEDIKLYGGSLLKKIGVGALYKYISMFERYISEALDVSNRFTKPARYSHLKQLAGRLIGYGCKMGEGWLLSAEMMELAESGYGNIVCAQPFGCLPNHIVGKGMIRKIREIYPEANIVPIDYDPGATKVNQENRIKLMLSVAREHMEAEESVQSDVDAIKKSGFSERIPEPVR